MPSAPFVNLGVDEVLSDLSRVVELLAPVNPRAGLILTVSPVQLAAAAVPGAHVLSATTHSKSVLRVAAEQMRARYRNIHCFPSHEIIAGSCTRGACSAEDLRNVVEAGVSHVMRLFLAHATGSVQGGAPGPAPAPPAVDTPAAAEAPSLGRAIVDAECDESALDR